MVPHLALIHTLRPARLPGSTHWIHVLRAPRSGYGTTGPVLCVCAYRSVDGSQGDGPPSGARSQTAKNAEQRTSLQGGW